MRDEYMRRRDYLFAELRKMDFSFPLPEGAFYMFVPMKRALLEKILKKGVIIVPGDAFGCNAPEYARMSYAASMENLKIAVERIQAAAGE
jgi:aspartate aminotransferase